MMQLITKKYKIISVAVIFKIQLQILQKKYSKLSVRISIYAYSSKSVRWKHIVWDTILIVNENDLRSCDVNEGNPHQTMIHEFHTHGDLPTVVILINDNQSLSNDSWQFKHTECFSSNRESRTEWCARSRNAVKQLCLYGDSHSVLSIRPRAKSHRFIQALHHSQPLLARAVVFFKSVCTGISLSLHRALYLALESQACAQPSYLYANLMLAAVGLHLLFR